jgi:hypothetical protein
MNVEKQRSREITQEFNSSDAESPYFSTNVKFQKSKILANSSQVTENSVLGSTAFRKKMSNFVTNVDQKLEILNSTHLQNSSLGSKLQNLETKDYIGSFLEIKIQDESELDTLSKIQS